MSENKVHKLTLCNTKEENQAVLKECVAKNEELNTLRETLVKKGVVDILDSEQFPIGKPNFSWKKVREKLAMREADNSSLFPALTRAGVQLSVNSLFESTKVTYDEFTHSVMSDKAIEYYAPLQGITFPQEIGEQESFPESTAASLSIQLPNRKYGQIFGVTKELINGDDQTGQFAKQAGLIGQYLKIVLEVLVYGKLSGVSGCSYAGMSVPKSETQDPAESSWPYSTALVGGGANRPASFVALSQAAIQAGMITLRKQKNKLGLFMGVDPDTLICSPLYAFDSAVLANSAFYPSVPGSAGSTGGNFAINPMQGLFKTVISPYVFDNAGSATGQAKSWFICDSKKPFFVVQMRQAPSVEQEAPNSGQGFERDVIRFKGEMRANADFISPLFIYQGNDGSV